MLPTIEEVETRLLAAAPGAREVLERLGAELPDADRRGAARLAADLDLRRRLERDVAEAGSVARAERPRPAEQAASVGFAPTRAGGPERQLRVDLRDRPRVRGDQLGQAAGGDRPGPPARRAPRGSGRRSRRPGRRSRRRGPTGAPRSSSCRSRAPARRTAPSSGAPPARTARPSRSRSPARAPRRRTRPPPRRRRSSSTCRSRRRSTARRGARAPRPRSRSGPGPTSRGSS